MILRLDDYIQEAYATVFFDKKKNLVYKVFKSYHHPDNTDKNSYYKEQSFNEWMHNIYNSEIKAFEIISYSNIRQYFLKLHSGVSVEKIEDKQGNDISEHYLLNCTYTVDHIPGPIFNQYEPIVRTYCLQNGIELDQIFRKLMNMGVNHIKDARIILLKHFDSRIIIVNFATCDPKELQPASRKETKTRTNKKA